MMNERVGIVAIFRGVNLNEWDRHADCIGEVDAWEDNAIDRYWK